MSCQGRVVDLIKFRLFFSSGVDELDIYRSLGWLSSSQLKLIIRNKPMIIPETDADC